jgi:uncharacterized membrane protein
MLKKLRLYLIAGLLVWLPVLATFFVIAFIVRFMDTSLNILPKDWQPTHLLGFYIPGIGVVFSLVILFFTGMFVTNFFGEKLVGFWDRLIDRIPLVRSVHAGVKQVLETLFKPGGTAFRKVVLVEYPRKGLWSIAFQTGKPAPIIEDKLGEDLITIFIPTTPNPTSGFLMMVKKADTHELDISVDQALKMVISLGVVMPKTTKAPEKLHNLASDKPTPH